MQKPNGIPISLPQRIGGKNWMLCYTVEYNYIDWSCGVWCSVGRRDSYKTWSNSRTRIDHLIDLRKYLVSTRDFCYYYYQSLTGTEEGPCRKRAVICPDIDRSKQMKLSSWEKFTEEERKPVWFGVCQRLTQRNQIQLFGGISHWTKHNLRHQLLILIARDNYHGNRTSVAFGLEFISWLPLGFDKVRDRAR